ncbi:transposon TX1 uncharacterized 149 kDa protein [Elysia marginata]|uniref:Transposon TX1 uncharacterized 149 kDa protein n=1 Tax=Elysia marginata TaxID=1093978 RepID=A0AAV4IMN6_9GAST|nr:transposon TX1 uncharacterized 149 kDa protein [Elysia marginata]
MPRLQSFLNRFTDEDIIIRQVIFRDEKDFAIEIAKNSQNGDDTQLAIRKGKGTRDGIFLLRNTCERIMECQKVLNLCLDAKAFDRVNHEKLMKVLAKAGISSHERRLVSEIYWNKSAKVKLTSETTEDIMIQRGVRQGCILSPSLFNLYSEYLLQEAISEKSGILINGVHINNI